MVQPTLERAMTHITLAQLEKHGACTEQLLLFKQMFGDSVQVTEALAIEVAEQFDFAWAADELLGDDARAEYYKLCHFFYEEYKKVRNLAWAEYDQVRESAWAEYKKVDDFFYEKYSKVRESAWAEYCKVCASAFARLYIAQE
jgi:hypothetical protein